MRISNCAYRRFGFVELGRRQPVFVMREGRFFRTPDLPLSSSARHPKSPTQTDGGPTLRGVSGRTPSGPVDSPSKQTVKGYSCESKQQARVKKKG